MTLKQAVVFKINNLLCNIQQSVILVIDKKVVRQKINPLTFSPLTNPPMTFHLKQQILFSV